MLNLWKIISTSLSLRAVKGAFWIYGLYISHVENGENIIEENYNKLRLTDFK